MSLNGVQQWVVSQMNGLETPYFPAAIAYAEPPVVDDIVTAPRIYVWGGRLREERFVGARALRMTGVDLPASGQKLVRHSVDVWPTVIMAADDPNANAFTILVDAIMGWFRGPTTLHGGVYLPVNVTDPNTGEASVIQSVGEHFDLEYATPSLVGDGQSMYLYAAMLTMAVEEVLPG